MPGEGSTDVLLAISSGRPRFGSLDGDLCPRICDSCSFIQIKKFIEILELESISLVLIVPFSDGSGDGGWIGAWLAGVSLVPSSGGAEERPWPPLRRWRGGAPPSLTIPTSALEQSSRAFLSADPERSVAARGEEASRLPSPPVLHLGAVVGEMKSKDSGLEIHVRTQIDACPPRRSA